MKAAWVWSSGGYGYPCASQDQRRHRAPGSGTIPAASRWTWRVNTGGVEKFPFLAVRVCTTPPPLFHIFEGRPRRLTKPGKNTPELATRRIIPVIPTVLPQQRGSEPPPRQKTSLRCRRSEVFPLLFSSCLETDDGFGDSRVFAPFSYTYLWSTVVYKILFFSTGSSLHSTLYTGGGGLGGGPGKRRGSPPRRDPPPSDRLEDVFEQVHRPHDVLILWDEDKSVRARSGRRPAAVVLRFGSSR